MGYPPHSWMVSWKIPKKWMIYILELCLFPSALGCSVPRELEMGWWSYHRCWAARIRGGLGPWKRYPERAVGKVQQATWKRYKGKTSTNHSNNRYQMVSDHRAGSQWIRFFGWLCRTSWNMLQISGNTALSSVDSDLYRALPMSLVNRWIGARICWWISYSGASCASLDDSKSPSWLGICSAIFHIAPFEVFGFETTKVFFGWNRGRTLQ